MNKKDINSIAYVLSSSNSLEAATERLFQLYPALEDEYKAYEYIAGRDRQVVDLYHESMTRDYGEDWALLRRVTKEANLKHWEDARRQVYGEDYEFVFGKK